MLKTQHFCREADCVNTKGILKGGCNSHFNLGRVGKNPAFFKKNPFQFFFLDFSGVFWIFLEYIGFFWIILKRKLSFPPLLPRKTNYYLFYCLSSQVLFKQPEMNLNYEGLNKKQKINSIISILEYENLIGKDFRPLHKFSPN